MTLVEKFMNFDIYKVKKIAFYILIFTQTFFLISCAGMLSMDTIYEKTGSLATNNPNVYVKDFACVLGNPSGYGKRPSVNFTLVNKSNCEIDSTVKVILYDGSNPVDSCDWTPYSSLGPLSPMTGAFGTTSSFSSCNCQDYRRIEFRVTQNNSKCN